MFDRVRIIVVDDNRSLTAIVKQLVLLHEPDIEVIEVHHGKEGLKLIREIKPDLIILDVNLPDISGCEVCHIIKTQESLFHIPVIVVTGLSAQRDLKVKFLEMGADAFLNKPFDESELIAQIRALLRLKKAEDQLRKEKDDLERRVLKQNVELSEQENRWGAIFEFIVGGIWDWDLRNNKIYISNHWMGMLGYKQNEASNDDLDFFLSVIHPSDRERFLESIRKKVEDKESEIQSEIRLKLKNGKYHWYLYRGHFVYDQEGKAIRLVGVHTDITNQKEEIINLEKMALYDHLTRLPNRVLFYDFTEKMIAAAKRSKDRIGILFLDIDDFKQINDKLGHHIGDEVLEMAAERLKSLIRPFDFVARLGGDEFTIALYNLQSESELATIIQRLRDGMKEPLDIEEHDITIRFSIGASVYPDDAEKIDDLLRIADKKMYSDKKRKKQES